MMKSFLIRYACQLYDFETSDHIKLRALKQYHFALFKGVFGLICLCGLFSCASIPQAVPVSGELNTQVVTSFIDMNQRQSLCSDTFDVDLTVSYDSVFFDGAVKGYFQALAPRYFRFEGVNPLGLTEIILVTNGSDFHYVAVRDQKEFVGNLDAQKVRRYASQKLTDSVHFDWFVGRLSHYSNLRIEAVGQEKGTDGYWLDLLDEGNDNRYKVLFDQDKQAIARTIIMGKNGDENVDLTYSYQDRSQKQNIKAANNSNQLNECKLPTSIIVETSGNGAIRFDITQQYPASEIDQETFIIKAPGGFERIIVQ